MSAAELKKTKLELKNWIDKLSDVNIINFLNGLKSTDEKGDWWDTILSSHQQQISRGVVQARNGQTMSSPEFWDKLKNG